jgi:FtsH-binding integral membrane protein
MSSSGSANSRCPAIVHLWVAYVASICGYASQLLVGVHDLDMNDPAISTPTTGYTASMPMTLTSRLIVATEATWSAATKKSCEMFILELVGYGGL